MVVITREEIEAWEAGNDTSRDPEGNVTFHRPPTPRERVYNAVLESRGAVTRGQIAQAMGLKKSPWLTAVIDGLVAEGYLTRSHGRWKNGCLLYLYEVNK